MKLIWIEEEIIQNLLERYFKRNFPSNEGPFTFAGVDYQPSFHHLNDNISWMFFQVQFELFYSIP